MESRTISEDRLKKGPVAVIECFEEIPCNPCQTYCPKNAISLKDSIVSLPELDYKRCTGCGVCIPACPGMAIFVIDGSYSDTEGLVSIPYEFYPLPKEGQTVDITDREGKRVGTGQIFRVRASKSFDSTAVVTVKAPKEMLMVVRGFNMVEGDE